MPSSILVLGAGMVGTSTALLLQQRGHDVLLIDRGPPGQETSFGNGGLIQREAVMPYAFPRSWRKLMDVAWGRPTDVHYHWSALRGLAVPLMRYWHHSSVARHAQAAQHYARLIAHCLDEQAPLIEAVGAQHLVRREGFRKAYRSQAAFDLAARDAQRLSEAFGIGHAVMDGAALAAAEPALHTRLAGAVHWLDAWSVSEPGELVARYARLFQARGGRIVQADATGLQAHGGGWRVRAGEGWLEAGHAVLALGPWSDLLTRSLGYRLPLFVKRGYHRHYQGGPALALPLLDAEQGFLLVPARQGLRLTTGAEFAHRDAPATPVQVERAEARARELMDLGRADAAPPWLGSRPCMPDMLPVMGPAPRHKGLWFNFGHGHQGFTLGPVAGRLLAEMVSGETPFLDPAPYRADRFS